MLLLNLSTITEARLYMQQVFLVSIMYNRLKDQIELTCNMRQEERIDV